MQTVENEIADIFKIKLKDALQKYVRGKVEVSVYQNRHNRTILRVEIIHEYYTFGFNIDQLYDRVNGIWSANDLALIILKKYRKRINNLFFT